MLGAKSEWRLTILFNIATSLSAYSNKNGMLGAPKSTRARSHAPLAAPYSYVYRTISFAARGSFQRDQLIKQIEHQIMPRFVMDEFAALGNACLWVQKGFRGGEFNCAIIASASG